MASLIPSGSASGTGSVTLTVPTTNNNQTATLPDATGTVMVSGNMPAFSAYASATSSAVSNGVDTKVLFDIKTFDTNSNFASSRFTPTVAGYYQINTTIRFNGTFTNCGLILFKNGGNAGYLGTTASTSAGIVSGSSLQYMNGSTDYLEIYVNMTGTGLTVSSGNANTSYFSGSLVRS